MYGLKLLGWEFLVKAIEFLDSQLGIEYISTPAPLLWRVIRESMIPCSGNAVKFLTGRLLKVLSLPIPY